MFECCFRSLAILLFVLDIAMLPSVSHAAPKPVPKSPYIGIVYRYADAVLAHGRDTQGPQATGLILSALDRKSIGPLTNRPHAPAGLPEAVRAGESNGPLVGANLLHDANLLRLLYTLSELSSKPVYRDAADGELKWLLQNAALTKSVGAPWDDGVAWNVILDEPLRVAMAEALPRRAWMLWDRSFELAPDVSRKWVLALCDQLADGDVAPRRAGFALAPWLLLLKKRRMKRCIRTLNRSSNESKKRSLRQWKRQTLGGFPRPRRVGSLLPSMSTARPGVFLRRWRPV